MFNFLNAHIPNSPDIFCPMPKWVYQTLVRNKINVMEFRNYGKIRSVLSLNDLRDWALSFAAFTDLSNTHRVNNLFGYSDKTDFAKHFTNLSNEQLKELKISVMPIVGAEESVSYIKNRFTLPADEAPHKVISLDGETSCYNFVNDIDVVYVIIDEGIINTLQTKQGAFDFSKKCVQQFYSMMPLSDVSCLGIYSVYLKELQGSVL